ncbi:MAG: peptidoglycan-binding protein [bacterium]|jgi:N-acetylmuramoyl-L-alanine amidase
MAEDHTVRQGESVMSIAEENGFLCETLWNHPKNSQLKAKRGDPNVLMPGDVLHIPDRREKKESAGVEQCHNFKRKGIPAVVRVVLRRAKKPADEKIEQEAAGPSEYKDPDLKPTGDEPMADVPYAVYAGGKLVKEGKTGGDGKVETKIPPGAGSAWIVLEQGTPKERTLNLNIRQMDPIDEIPGICKRLNNLGYFCPPDAAEESPEFKEAVKAFQSRNGIEETGKVDGRTRSAIKDAYGG